jgi:two-component system, response regulator FlrC
VSLLPILIVEDDRDLREALVDTLTLAGYEPLGVEDGPQALRLLENRLIGLVISDVQMQPMDGHALLQAVKAAHPEVPVMLMTAYGMIDKAVEAMRAGACTYLTKPFEPDRLLEEVARYMRARPDAGAQAFETRDRQVQLLLTMARKVAPTTATILITGESGCGKEVLARYLHCQSDRSKQPFVAVNCAAIPDSLLESTLFGYEKGAFSGATGSHAGKFEQAQHGTLLLDEISEMPLALQAKLLRVLQEREVERLGSHKTVKLDVRIIATSNRDMAAQVAAGEFREDLFYRLNVFPLHLPALRERPDDILPLAQYFLSRPVAGAAPAHAYTLTPPAAQRLMQHAWPGNIRELENVMQRAMIMAPAELIAEEHLYLPPPKVTAPPAAPLAGGRITDIKKLEREHILETLAAANGSRKLAGQMLGMSERTLRYKLQQYRKQDADKNAGTN